MALRRTLRVLSSRLPADLAAIVGLVIFTNLTVFAPVIRETPLRVGFGLAFVLFVPGYALIAALFPEAGGSSTVDQSGAGDETEDSSLRERGIDGIERVALSFGLSIAVVPLIGLILNFTPWGIRLNPIMVALTVFTLGMTVIAVSRRAQLPSDEQFSVPYRSWIQAGGDELFSPQSRTDAALNILLIVCVMLAIGSVGYAVGVPQQGESFSEFYLLTENESGDLVADGYPTDFEQGQSQELVVGVGNQEHEEIAYTVVVEIQQVEIVDNETRVQNATELRRFQPTVAHNETWQRQHTVTPQMTGERLRLQYLLYRGEPSTPLNRSDAYRELHLWVNVTATN